MFCFASFTYRILASLRPYWQLFPFSPIWTSSVNFLLAAWEMTVYIFVHTSEYANMLQIWTVQSNYHEFGGMLFWIISSRNVTCQLQTIYSQQNIVWIKHMWWSWGFFNSRWKIFVPGLFFLPFFFSFSLWIVAFGWIFALRVQVALIDITVTYMRIKSGKWIAFRGFRLMEQFHPSPVNAVQPSMSFYLISEVLQL